MKAKAKSITKCIIKRRWICNNLLETQENENQLEYSIEISFNLQKIEIRNGHLTKNILNTHAKSKTSEKKKEIQNI